MLELGGWLVRILFVILIVMSLWRARTWKLKLFYVAVTVMAFFSPALPKFAQEKAFEKKYTAAKAVFDERCKTSGDKVHQTANDVEGILLLNVRPERSRDSVRYDPNWPDAALPDESGGDWYIRSFLSWEHQQRPPGRGFLTASPMSRDPFLVLPGYSFVDVKQEDGAIYRYRYKQPPRIEMTRELVNGKPARYAVSFRNMVDPSDRSHWVAGTVVTITDTQTSELVAEKVWYAFEPGLGSQAGARTPWGNAIQCPSHRGWSGGMTRMFVDQVLKPKSRN